MKGYFFYLEFPTAAAKRKATVKKPDGHSGNVVAVLLSGDNHPIYYPCSSLSICVDALSAVFEHPNSDVASGGVSTDYLDMLCKRIPEKLAREIHPRLFARLDQEN